MALSYIMGYSRAMNIPAEGSAHSAFILNDVIQDRAYPVYLPGSGMRIGNWVKKSYCQNPRVQVKSN